MAMDRVQLLLVGLPALLFLSDLSHIFAPPPPHLRHGHPPHHPHGHPPHHHHPGPANTAIQLQPNLNGAGLGTTVDLQFCASSFYNGNAMAMKRMLETSFPGITVFLYKYPPTFSTRVLRKVVPVLQVGGIATTMTGDQIFPRLGIAPPPWFYSLRANRFGTVATIWLFGNFAQFLLQSSGAFEVYCNRDLVRFQITQEVGRATRKQKADFPVPNIRWKRSR